LRLAAKRSPPASVTSGLMVRRRAAGAFEAGLWVSVPRFGFSRSCVLTFDAHDGVGN
jgi:hypothetical protein